MSISLIVTTRNEATSIARLLASIRAQTRPPDEIVLVDGGSTDGTLDIVCANADQLPLTVISQPGANISQGRNAAIRAATGDIVASTDAGVRLDPHWLERITQPLRNRAAEISIVSGFFIPDAQTVFETALAATTLPALTDVRPAQFLPSSRSIAFSKEAWTRVGGYPEWLDYCEDLVFDFALRAAQLKFAFVPDAIVYFRPRPDLAAFFKQYYHYARGDGKADLWLKRHLLRYVTYLVGLPVLLVLTWLVPFFAFWGWLAGALVFFYTPYKRLLPMLRDKPLAEKFAAILWVPVIRLAGDVAKMLGYPVGIAWRLRRR